MLTEHQFFTINNIDQNDTGRQFQRHFQGVCQSLADFSIDHQPIHYDFNIMFDFFIEFDFSIQVQNFTVNPCADIAIPQSSFKNITIFAFAATDDWRQNLDFGAGR